MKSIFAAFLIIILSSFFSPLSHKSIDISVKYTEITYKNNNGTMRTSDAYVVNNSDYNVTAIVKKSDCWAGTCKESETTYRLKPGQERYVGQTKSGGYGTPLSLTYTIVRDFKGWD